MKNTPFDFHGSKFTIKILSSETYQRYTVLNIIHAPNIGPAEHHHPAGPETFYIIQGEYEFFVSGKSIRAQAGDAVTVPTGIQHRFITGPKGGHAIVISPPNLEFYFWEVSELLKKGDLTFEQESQIAKKHGQVFSDSSKHWQ